MDARQFDAFTKVVARGLSRRRLLRALGLLPAIGALNSRGAAAQSTCSPGQYPCGTGCCPNFAPFCEPATNACCIGPFCGGLCTSPGTICCDPATHHACGQGATCCGTTCCVAGETCVDPAINACGSCPSGGTPCNGECVDTSSDPNNRGACGHACTGGLTCVGGACVCLSPTPDVCDGQCTNLQTSGANCGTCGTACPASAPCQGGACTCPGTSLPPCGQECCNPLTQTCTTDFGNSHCCANAQVCGGACCAGCCADAGSQTCGATCGPHCCPPGTSCVHHGKGRGKGAFRCV